MASGSTLRFSVEVAADQAEGALKAMTSAFSEAGIKANAALLGIGKGGKQAAGGLEDLKKGMVRARETAMFFTQSLQGFGPAGQMAQTALTGIAGAMIGGGGLLAGLALARVGIELLADAWTAESKAAKDAADKSLKASKDIADAAVAAANQKTLEADRKLYTERFLLDRKFLEDRKKLNLEIAESRKTTGDDVVSEDTKKLIAERDRLTDAYTREKEALKRLEAQGKSERAAASAERKAAKAEKTPEEIEAEYKKKTAAYMAGVEKELKADEDAATARGELMLKEQELDRNRAQARAKKIQDEVALYASIGEQVGTVMAQVATGQKTMAEGIVGSMKSVVNAVIDAAKTWILADAAASAASAFKSQAGIPVVGPYLGAAAMIAALSLVQGLVASVPSAAGGWKVPHDTLAMVHENERILPARYSKGLDRMVEGGGGGGGITINLTATDGKSVRRLLLDNQPALAEAIGKAILDGRRLGRAR